uniref:MHC class I antigen n=1 Tax=Chelonoidis abingdonii TaxID=106734 RepID=A0A8C0GGH6_CHEAB
RPRQQVQTLLPVLSAADKLNLTSVALGHHSLAVLVTAIINKDGTHHFIMIARLDDIKIAYYRSDTREVRPTQEWVAQTLGAEYLQEKTQQFWRHEEGSKVETRSVWRQRDQVTSWPRKGAEQRGGAGGGC